MARASSLDPVPDKSPRSGFSLRHFSQPKRSGPATFEQYQQIMADRPVKFSAEQVNYREADGEEQCSKCFHFFIGALAGRNVCEILRVSTETIRPDWVCSFVTQDGENFPLLEDQSSTTKS